MKEILDLFLQKNVIIVAPFVIMNELHTKFFKP